MSVTRNVLCNVCFDNRFFVPQVDEYKQRAESLGKCEMTLLAARPNFDASDP